MKVILIKNVPKIGNAGEEQEVKEGFAKNYLLPKGLAVMPNDPRGQKLMAGFEKKTREKARELALISQKVLEIENETIEIKARTNEKGQLFASINQAEIKKIALEKFGIVPQGIGGVPIKTVGEHVVELGFTGGTKARLKVIVQK